jgi:hypothetical protein
MRIRTSRSDYYRKWRSENRSTVRAYKREHPKPPAVVVGIDGEGLQIEGKHIYRYLAAWTDTELAGEVENPKGLTPDEVFELLFSIKETRPGCMIVGFSLGYDYTKWMEGIPCDIVYHLVRPETRRGEHGGKPIRYGWHLLNYLRGRFTLTRLIPEEHRKQCHSAKCPGCKHGASVSVWDVWGFYQGSFIDACKNWEVIGIEEYERLKTMKDKRATFSLREWKRIKEYCGEECRHLAKLVTKLRESHETAGLPLKSYYGAGSTASVLLNKMRIKDYLPKGEKSKELKYAIACAFSGGRFEPSIIGPVTAPVESADIASAYPYHLWQLPCLACGTWKHVKRNVHQAIERSRWALVRYTLPKCDAVPVKNGTSSMLWGPFPLRTESVEGIDDGCIVYPVTSGGGWVYRDEYLAGHAGWPNVKAVEAWIYDTPCDHVPFGLLPSIYLERLKWGKDGPGIVLKLGPNSCYGKVAQSIGHNPPFQCFEWAGMITSNTRAQLLRAMTLNLDAILMTATDSILSLKALELEKPKDSRTENNYGKPPLGGWEKKTIPDGVMIIRAGIAFPLRADDMKETKARGVGKAVLNKHRQRVLDSWAVNGPKSLVLESTIFRGMKSCTQYLPDKGYSKHEEYGQWVPRTTTVSYMPEPKRPFIVEDSGRLHTWAFNRNVKSAPYRRILGQDVPISAEGLILKELETMRSEQPDREISNEEF